MKPLLLSIVLFVGLSANAQYVSVIFYSPPAPTNLWESCWYEMTPNRRPGDVLFTANQFVQYMTTNMDSFYAWRTNAANPQSAIDANIARLVDLFNQIPSARLSVQSISTNAAMTQAQAVAAVRQEANIIDGILEELQRLGPILRGMYMSQDNPVQ